MTPAIKEGAVIFFKEFLDEVMPTNQCIKAFNERPISSKFKLVTGRLVDQAEAMLNKWRTNPDQDKNHHKLPVFIMGFGKEYSSSGLEKGKTISQHNYVVSDNQGNYFNLRLDKHDQRVQIALFSQDEETAFSFASQFKLYCARYDVRHQYAVTDYNGINYAFPMSIEDNNIFAPTQTIDGQDNLTILTFDITFNCHTPYFLGQINEKNQQVAPYLPVVTKIILKDEANERHDIYKSVITENGIENLLISEDENAFIVAS